jgi:hypothetical protein
MTIRYHQLQDGEWMRPTRRGFRDACCDCGLVHRMEFRIVEGTIEFRSTRDNKATAAMRRRMNVKG